jgi:hypothetical protein
VPTYATAAELRSYCAASGVAVPGEDADANELLERAERDLDRLLSASYVPNATGRKVDPSTLTIAARAALSRATCAAAEWRLAQEEEELVGATDGVVGVAGLTFAPGPLPRPPGPKVAEELANSGLRVRSGTLPEEVDAAP